MNIDIEKAIQYNTCEEPIVISKLTLDRLLKLDHPGDSIALYCFYYYTAKWQHTNTPLANNSYTQTGLHWTKGRLARAKRDLIKLHLVEIVRTRDVNTKTFNKPLLKINFIWWSKEKIEAIGQEKPYDTKSHRMADLPQIGSTNIGKKDLTNSNFFDPEDLPGRYSKHPAVMKAWAAFVQDRKERKKPLTKGAYTLLINKMDRHSPEEIVTALEQAIERRWLSIFYEDKAAAQQLPSCSQATNGDPDDDIKCRGTELTWDDEDDV